MATPPVRPSTPPPKPAPVEEKTEPIQQMQVNIHGIPPKPNMEDLPPTDERHIPESTRIELEMGRQSIALSEARRNAELEAGKKAIAHFYPNSESGEETSSQP